MTDWHSKIKQTWTISKQQTTQQNLFFSAYIRSPKQKSACRVSTTSSDGCPQHLIFIHRLMANSVKSCPNCRRTGTTWSLTPSWTVLINTLAIGPVFFHNVNCMCVIIKYLNKYGHWIVRIKKIWWVFWLPSVPESPFFLLLSRASLSKILQIPELGCVPTRVHDDTGTPGGEASAKLQIDGRCSHPLQRHLICATAPRGG